MEQALVLSHEKNSELKREHLKQKINEQQRRKYKKSKGKKPKNKNAIRPTQREKVQPLDMDSIISEQPRGKAPQKVKHPKEAHYNEPPVRELSPRNQQSFAPSDQQADLNNDGDCSHCSQEVETLKNLVFSAKQAIDQLKSDIEEWKEVCSSKEKEIRKLRASKKSSKKNVGFQKKPIATEYDEDRPVNELKGGSKSFVNVGTSIIEDDFPNPPVKKTSQKKRKTVKQILNAGKKKKPAEETVKKAMDSLLGFGEEELKEALAGGLSPEQKKMGIDLLSSLLQIQKAEMFQSQEDPEDDDSLNLEGEDENTEFEMSVRDLDC